MVELNKTINWKPASTGTGRFGNWLENMVDWNLSRSLLGNTFTYLENGRCFRRKMYRLDR
jgi:hypothetical protein